MLMQETKLYLSTQRSYRQLKRDLQLQIKINLLITITAALIAIAFYKLSERKFLRYIQNR